MNVLVCVPHPKAGWDDVRFVTLDELMKESDVVSLHCPLTEENRRMIDEKTIARMKPGMRIINTGCAEGWWMKARWRRLRKAAGWPAIWRTC